MHQITPTPENTYSELEMRKKLLAWAKAAGCEFEIRGMVKKYDLMMRAAQTELERRQIGEEGVREIELFMSIKNTGLVK